MFVVSRLTISLLLLLYTLVTQSFTGVPSLPRAAATISASGCERPPVLESVSAAAVVITLSEAGTTGRSAQLGRVTLDGYGPNALVCSWP